jgi:hypothetical protein
MSAQPATITLFNKTGGALSKSITLVDGIPVSDGSMCRMSEGTAEVVRAPDAATLAGWVNDAGPSVALALGTLKGVEIGARVPIVAKARANGQDGVFTRSLECMRFEQGREAWALLDFDRKGMPDAVAERLEKAGGFEAALAGVLPNIAETARVRRASTSAGLRNADTGELYPASGGLHLYPLVEDGTDIPRFVASLFERLWLAGFGWVTISTCGALLVRSIIDVAVRSPERLIFEGAPTLGAGLIQDIEARAAVATEGDPLATQKACTDLTIAEQATLRFMIDTAKAEKAREAGIVRTKWIDETAPKIAEKTGRPERTVRRELGYSFAGYLFPDFPLDFDDSGEGRVDDILADPERFIGATLRDPHEPDTQGRNCAIVQRRRDGRLAIFSFAHGGMRYLLAYDCPALLQLIARTEADAIPDVIMEALPYASLSAAEELKVHEAARTKAGWSKGDWSKLETKLLGPKKDRPRIEEMPLPDRSPKRPWLLEPFISDELNATLIPLDWLLCKVEAIEPPFRNLEGRYAVITERPLAKTHQLSTSEVTPKEKWLPPPPVTRLIEADKYQILSSIEPHVEYRHYYGTKPSEYHSVRLPTFFVDAYAGWALSDLPRVEAVLTLPIVWDGKLIGTPGLDPEQQVIFRIDERLTALLPKEPVPLATAKESYEWLDKAWLKDAAFKERKKDLAKAIAIALTIIERSLFNARPQFNVTGDMPGGGKSTLINMLVAVVTGHQAPASPWTDDPVERKKNIFAFCRAGTAVIVFDNIERGMVIDCPHLAMHATSTEMRDRVLGESRDEDAPARTIVILNGNAITVRGDLTSRTLTIEIQSLSANPAERAFEHEDPVAWTIDNRIEILRHLFNILMVERPLANRAKTRFKIWWRLVGQPLELVSGFDFGSELRDSTDNDEEMLARARVIQRLWAEFGKQPSLFADKEQSRIFTATEVATLLPKPDGVEPDRIDDDAAHRARQFADDLRAVANRKFAYTPEGVVKVLKNHVTGWVRLDDGSNMRLLNEIDPHSKRSIFYVEKAKM